MPVAGACTGQAPPGAGTCGYPGTWPMWPYPAGACGPAHPPGYAPLGIPGTDPYGPAGPPIAPVGTGAVSTGAGAGALNKSPKSSNTLEVGLVAGAGTGTTTGATGTGAGAGAAKGSTSAQTHQAKQQHEHATRVEELAPLVPGKRDEAEALDGPSAFQKMQETIHTTRNQLGGHHQCPHTHQSPPLWLQVRSWAPVPTQSWWQTGPPAGLGYPRHWDLCQGWR